MTTWLDYAHQDGDRPKRWPNLREAAAKPYMGQTAVIARRPWLVVGFDGEMYELEDERGERLRVNKFEVLDHHSENNRIIAATRVKGSPLDLGYALASCGCEIGLLDFDLDTMEWSVLNEAGTDKLDVEAGLDQLEAADWLVDETLVKEAIDDRAFYDPDSLAKDQYYCPDCGSPEVEIDDAGAFCPNCSWSGSPDELLNDDGMASYDDSAGRVPSSEPYGDDWQYEGMVKEAPGDKHLPYATPKRNRQYEHVLETCKKDHPDYSLDRCKELAARTVNKERKEKGETKDSAQEGIHDRADSTDVLKCPNCDSHTVELVNSENSEFHCLSCGERFKHDVIKNPKAPKQKQGTVILTDSNGKPITGGQYYNLHGDKYKIPDVIKVLEIHDGSVVATVEGNSHPLRLSPDDIQKEGYSFEPLPISSKMESHFLNTADSFLDTPSYDQPVPSDVPASDFSDAAYEPFVSGEEFTLPTPSGGTLWVRTDHSGHVTGWSIPGPDAGPGKYSTRDLEKIQGMVDEARAKAVRNPLAKTARRNFTPGEQKKLIEEKGEARNKHKLRLDESHYTEAKVKDDADFLW